MCINPADTLAGELLVFNEAQNVVVCSQHCCRQPRQKLKDLVSEQLLPPNLMSTAVRPSYFRRGVMELQLPASANSLWQQAWLTVSKGI